MHRKSVAMAGRKSSSKARATRPTTVAAYLASLAPERRAVIEEARALVHKHISKGYAEFMNWGVINWGIPLEEFADTYNGQPLCYVALSATKNSYSLYMMGAYGDSKQADALKAAFKTAGKKLDMGKSCIRFKSVDDLPMDDIGRLIGEISPDAYIARYESVKRRPPVKRAR